MNKTFWLLLGVMLSTGVMAQQVTNLPPAAAVGTPATPAAQPADDSLSSTDGKPKEAAPKPSKSKAKSKAKSAAPAAKKAAAPVLHSTPLTPGPAMVNASNVNVRGQAKLRSEVVTRITKGQSVTVLEEVVLNNSADDEPSAWAKILLPNNTPVWINSAFLTNNTVGPARLNVRSGPGENYSILGRLERGTEVKPITTKGGWTQIETPADAYAFVAAQYLKQEPAMEIAANTTKPVAETPSTPAPETVTVPETPATTETVKEAPTVAPAPSDAPALPSAQTNDIPVVAAPGTNAIPEVAGTDTNTVPEIVAEEPPPKRVVQREGFVRGTVSIQAPSHFALVAENGKLINYLYNTSPGLDLRRYKGLRVIVIGEEAIEERWGNTPVITIQKIDVLEE